MHLFSLLITQTTHFSDSCIATAISDLNCRSQWTVVTPVIEEQDDPLEADAAPPTLFEFDAALDVARSYAASIKVDSDTSRLIDRFEHDCQKKQLSKSKSSPTLHRYFERRTKKKDGSDST